jgi:hypothetical protein
VGLGREKAALHVKVLACYRMSQSLKLEWIFKEYKKKHIKRFEVEISGVCIG